MFKTVWIPYMVVICLKNSLKYYASTIAPLTMFKRFWTGIRLFPVFMDGELNYNDSVCIHRELL